MMRKAIAMALVLTCVLQGLAGNAQAEELRADKVIYKKKDAIKESNGIILEDNYEYLEIADGAAKFKIPADAVIRVLYKDSEYKKFAEAQSLVDGESYGAALPLLKIVQNKSKLKPNQKKLFEQRLNYLAAVCLFQTGQHKGALGIFQKVIASKPDTVHYFEAMLYEAKCYEAMGNMQKALERYRFCQRDFGGKLRKVKWQVPSMIRAALGELRMEMLSLEGKRGVEKAVREQESKLGKLMAKGKTYIDKDPSLQSEVVQIQAKIFKALKNYDKLAEILNKAIRNAQVEDDKATLEALYIDRADSYFGLYEAAGADAKAKKEHARAALFDYLRSVLAYELPPKLSAKANYRIGLCFKEIGGEGWRENATERLKIAQSLRQIPYSDHAKTLLEDLAKQ